MFVALGRRKGKGTHSEEREFHWSMRWARLFVEEEVGPSNSTIEIGCMGAGPTSSCSSSSTIILGLFKKEYSAFVGSISGDQWRCL